MAGRSDTTIDIDDGLPLHGDARGSAVVDVQARLAALHYDVSADPTGVYGPATEAAIRTFQADRGMRIDGVCGRYTWNSLVEAGFRLGDRLLYHRVPMLRGDDVAVLQGRLSAMGFHAGRIDGIFGPQTARALEEFQRNAGLVVDATCGRETVTALTRLGVRLDSGPTVAEVRERAHLLAQAPTLDGRTIVLGNQRNVGALADAVARSLRRAGASVVVLHDPADSAHASAANDAGADAYLGLVLDPDRDGVTTSYFALPGARSASVAGRRLATFLQVRGLEALGGTDGGINGMSLPILRETKMPAALCELGPAERVNERMASVAAALAAAVGAWVADPCD